MRPGDGETGRPPPERAIREALRAAHRPDAPPPFARLWQARGAAPRRRRGRLALVAGAVAAAALAAVLTGRGPADRSSPEMPAFVSHTDFLLEVRGLDFLETVPVLRPPSFVGGGPVADPLRGVLP